MLSSCHPFGGENTTVAKIVGSCLITLPQKMVIQMTPLITNSSESTLPLGDKNQFRIISWAWLLFFVAEDAAFCCKACYFCWGRGEAAFFLACKAARDVQNGMKYLNFDTTTGDWQLFASIISHTRKKRTTQWGFHHIS